MADKSPGKNNLPPRAVMNAAAPKSTNARCSARCPSSSRCGGGRNRSPSLERAAPCVEGEGTKSPEVEMAEEVFAEWSEGPGQEKRLRRDGASPPREATPPGGSSSRSEDEWEFVEGPDTSTLAEDIERRLEERRRMRSGSDMSPTREWDTIEQRLERHRQEVRQRLASPTPDWPQLRRSPVPRSSRDTSLERDTPVRSRAASGGETGKQGEQPVTQASSLTESPALRTQSTSKDLEEEDPASVGQEGYQRVEEEERESVESGARKRYSRVVVHRTTERTVSSTPSPEPSEHLPSERAATSPPPDSPDSHSARSRTPSGPRTRHPLENTFSRTDPGSGRRRLLRRLWKVAH
ncbi:serine/arginine repetitive matrix protein 1-like [Scylla paramamosain]|uniref:serine/arginine repetitive matrix protein 1-like n=1 Tax=Scylla paramamosain TaxID=85552 RepID=UPI003082E0EC